MKRDIHSWFGLTYSSYLVLHRSILQSMPEEWQHKFVELNEEIDKKGFYKLMPEDHGGFMVKLKNDTGKFIKDPLANYDRGSRDLNNELDEKVNV